MGVSFGVSLSVYVFNLMELLMHLYMSQTDRDHGLLLSDFLLTSVECVYKPTCAK